MPLCLSCLCLQHGTRGQGDVIFNSALGVIFGVKKYADALWKVVERKGIKVNLQRKLVMIRPREREAVFEVLDPEASEEQETFEVCYTFSAAIQYCTAGIGATQYRSFIFSHSFAMLHTIWRLYFTHDGDQLCRHNTGPKSVRTQWGTCHVVYGCVPLFHNV